MNFPFCSIALPFLLSLGSVSLARAVEADAAPASAVDPPAGKDASEDPRAAEARLHFSEGRKQMEAGKYKAACAAFEESLRHETHVGPMMNLALCQATRKSYASAYLTYMKTAELARKLGDDREAFARGEATAIAEQVQRVFVRISPDADDVVVRFEGRRMIDDDFARGIAVDPGSYRIEVDRPGQEVQVISVEVRPGFEVPVVEISRRKEEPPSAHSADAPLDDARSGPRVLPWIGIGVAGASGVAAIVGGAFYALGSKKAQAADCRKTTLICSEAGKKERDQGANQANSGVGLLAAGGALVVGGVITYFVTRRPALKESTGLRFDGLAVTSSGAYTSVGGSF